MKSHEIIRVVNDGSHRLVFTRDGELWSVEAERDGRWMPGIVVSEFDGMSAMKEGTLTALPAEAHVFFYASIEHVAQWIAGQQRVRACWLQPAYHAVACEGIRKGLLKFDRVTDVISANRLQAA